MPHRHRENVRPDHCIEAAGVAIKYLAPFCGFECSDTRCVKELCQVAVFYSTMYACMAASQLWLDSLRFSISKQQCGIQDVNALARWQSFAEWFKFHPRISTCPGSLTVRLCFCWLIVDFSESLCVFRLPWVLHQMPGWDPVPISYSHHLAVCGRGSVLRLRTRGPVRHRHHPPELLWGGTEPCGCTGCLHHVSRKGSHWI